MINTIKVLLLAVCVCMTLAQRAEDPLCVLKGCPSNKPCRVVTECVAPGVCSLQALCMETLPRWSHTGACQVGHPILIMRDGAWADTHCGPSLPCPDSTYCNTELEDTYSTCCRSDPANTVKPGDCLANTKNDTSDWYCIDTCKNDGDCRHYLKCCQNGCRRDCLPPEMVNICQSKKCPKSTYCLTPEMSPCTATGRCYNVGDCIPCGPLCKMACPGGFEKDPLGCPICQCKTPPNTVKPGDCLANTKNDTSDWYCIDTCKNDGDCRHYLKCCQNGCRRDCLPPEMVNICQSKKCPKSTYCLTPEMSPCTATGRCYNVGDCIPCGPLCKMACPGGFEKDPLGCPICQCKTPLSLVLVLLWHLPQQTSRQIYGQGRGSFKGLLWMYRLNNRLF